MSISSYCVECLMNPFLLAPIIQERSQIFIIHDFSLCFVISGDVMDILALINSAINFILYCAMSRQFRKTFNLLFCPKFIPIQKKDEEMQVAQGCTEMSGRDNGMTTCATHLTQF